MTLNRLSAGLLLTVSVSLILAVLLKDRYLWMDEVLSYLLLSDASIVHMNRAVVSGVDATPPLFPNVYWVLAHAISPDT